MGEKNLLLLSMSILHGMSESYYEGDYGEKCYFRGVSQLEAGTKFYLRKLERSNRKIDKIFIVESPKSKERTKERAEFYDFLSHPTDMFDENSSKISAVDFYMERISQYIQGREKVKLPYKEVKEEAKYFFGFLRKKGLKKTKTLLTDPKLPQLVNKYEKGEDVLRNDYPDIKSLFKPINLEEDEYTTRIGRNDYETALFKCINELCDEIQAFTTDGSKVNLFVDMQGARRYETFIINAAIKMLESRNIMVEESVATDFNGDNNKNGEFNEIVDTIDNQMLDMVSGMNEFIKTGRGDTLLQFIDTPEETEDLKPEHEIIESIKKISDSISLCNVTGYDKSLQSFKIAVNDYNPRDHQGSLFATFIPDLRQDYENYKLLEGQNSNTLDQISWCLEKKLYQQALTLVEAKLPEIISEKILYYGANNDKLGRLLDLELQKGNKCGIPDYLLTDITPENEREEEDEDYTHSVYTLKPEYRNFVWGRYLIRGNMYYENDRDLTRLLKQCLEENNGIGWPFLPTYLKMDNIDDKDVTDRLVKEKRFIRRGKGDNYNRNKFKIGLIGGLKKHTNRHGGLDPVMEREISKLLISYHALCDIRNDVNHANGDVTAEEVSKKIEIFIAKVEELLLNRNLPVDYSYTFPINA